MANYAILCHADGTNGSTTYTNAGTGGTLARTGSAALATAQFKFGTASSNHTVNGSVLSASSVTLAGDFTVSFQILRVSGFGGKPFCIGSEGTLGGLMLEFFVNQVNLQATTSGGGNTNIIALTGTNLGDNGTGWHHVVITRIGTTLRLVVDGVSQGTVTNSTSFSGRVMFGDKAVSPGTPEGGNIGGYLDELLVINDAALYSTFPFTPPTAAYTIPGGTAYDLAVDPVSYALTAAAETVTATRALTIAPVSYSITAQAVNLAVGRVLSVSPVSYTLSAANVTLATTRQLSINASSYAVGAAAITLTTTRALSIDPASYALTAAAVTLTPSRALSVDPVSYSLSAADVALTYGTNAKELLIDPASYTLTVSNVTLSTTRALTIDPASYSLTNSAITLSVGRALSVSPVSYALTAGPVTLAVGRVLAVAPAAYTLTPADVTLTFATSNPVLVVDPLAYVLSLPDVELEFGRSGGGRDDSKRKARKRVNELNKKILQAEALEEAQEITQVAVTKAKTTKVEPDEWDEDEEEALMLLI